MIKEVKNVEDANKCDELLTKLILDERKYNDLIDNNIVIKNHFSKMLDDEDVILLAYYLDKLIVGYILIRKINEKDTPVVFILWGNFAKSKKNLITNPKHLVIESSHPSPFSCNYGFFGSRPFSKANNFLKEHNIKEIDFTVK